MSSFSDNYLPHVKPFHHQLMTKFGTSPEKSSLCFGAIILGLGWISARLRDEPVCLLLLGFVLSNCTGNIAKLRIQTWVHVTLIEFSIHLHNTSKKAGFSSVDQEHCTICQRLGARCGALWYILSLRDHTPLAHTWQRHSHQSIWKPLFPLLNLTILFHPPASLKYAMEAIAIHIIA